MRCKGCSCLKVGFEEDLDYAEIARARCMATSKKGKVVTWATTSYYRINGMLEIAETGIDAVNVAIDEQVKSPKWCPMRKETIKWTTSSKYCKC